MGSLGELVAVVGFGLGFCLGFAEENATPSTILLVVLQYFVIPIRWCIQQIELGIKRLFFLKKIIGRHARFHRNDSSKWRPIA